MNIKFFLRIIIVKSLFIFLSSCNDTLEDEVVYKEKVESFKNSDTYNTSFSMPSSLSRFSTITASQFGDFDNNLSTFIDKTSGLVKGLGTLRSGYQTKVLELDRLIKANQISSTYLSNKIAEIDAIFR